MNVSEKDFFQMKDHLTKELVYRLMEDYDLSLKQAFDKLYDSDTYRKLSNPDSGLYFQSADYVYDYLKNE